MFWFSLFDCVPYFGMLDDCINPDGRRRLSYYAYQEAAEALR